MDYTDINSRTIDKWVDEGWEWARPVSHEEYIKALEGNGKIFLTRQNQYQRPGLAM